MSLPGSRFLTAPNGARYNEAEITHVHGTLWLGDAGSAWDSGLLVRLGIKAIVNCASSVVRNFHNDAEGADSAGQGSEDMEHPVHSDPSFTYWAMPMLDDPEPESKSTRMIHVACQFIKDFLQKDPEAGVLIHCFAGANRSATVTAAYLSLTLRIPVSKSVAYLKSIRPVVDPHEFYLHELQEFQRDYIKFSTLEKFKHLFTR